MAGALLLARATEGAPLSAELLAAARERLLPTSGSAGTNADTRAGSRRKKSGT